MPSSAIKTLSFSIGQSTKDKFAAWQGRLNEVITGFPGFISLEFISLAEGKWSVVERFADTASAEAWEADLQYRELLKELQELNTEKTRQEKSRGSHFSKSVVEVFVTQVSPDKIADYRAWSARMHQVEAKFPGFQRAYVQAPSQDKGGNWITMLQFDTVENLDYWLNSPERQQVLQESATFVTSLENHRIISPFSGWFNGEEAAEESSPVWKQTMIILLVLYPIVMLELKYLFPLLGMLNSSFSTFIANAISVSLISYPMMPIAIKWLGWWLSPRLPRYWQQTIVGTLLLFLLYAIEIAVFWDFLS